MKRERQSCYSTELTLEMNAPKITAGFVRVFFPLSIIRLLQAA